MGRGRPGGRGAVLDWVRHYSAVVLHEDVLEALTRAIDDQVVVEMTEFRADAGVRRELDASTREALRSFVTLLSRNPDDTPQLPPASLELARTLARRGHDVGVVLRLYRIGQRVAWSELMGIVHREVADPELRMAILNYLWDRMSRVLEFNIGLLVSIHTEEAERMLRGALARKLETVHAILRGDQPDLDTASARLGHNLHRTQTGLVLWATDDVAEPDPSGLLEQAAGEIAEAAGAERPLTVQAGAREVWAWLAGAPADVASALGRAPTLRREPGVRVTAGIPARGLDGFARSHREAVLARAVADAAPRATGQVVSYSDVEIVSCLNADPESLRALMARELGPLGGDDPGQARLRATVLAYLRAGANARAAAEALGVHKNTVLYRIKQAEELLGAPVERRRLHLELALTAHALLG